MSYNRFGFSSKKPDLPRPTATHHPQAPAFNTASVKRTNSFGNRNNQQQQNVDFTPSFGAKLNQPLSFGHETASLRKFSTGKNGFNQMAIRNGIQSTIKPASRAMPTPNMRAGIGFGSARKSSINSKLFQNGVTPQHSRASYMKQNRLSTTSRLSRSSMRGGKDNRPLSDATFHRECQDKILEFLSTSDYPHPLTKQTLLRPSTGDVSRIFEYLFSFFQPDVVIKNGPTTSIEVVVPKILAELGYPFQLKRSDLVSFSGGRQLGAILESICFVVGVISYIDNVEVTRFNKDLELEEFAEENNNFNAQIAELAFESSGSEEVGEQTIQEVKALVEKNFGTEEQIQQMQSEDVKLQQNLKRLEEETAYHIELPNKIAACKEELDNYQSDFEKISAKEEECKKFTKELLEEIEGKECQLKNIHVEEKELQAKIDSQKEIIMDYRLSVERKNQISEEIEKENKHILDINEQIFATTIEESKQKAQNSSFINDLEDIIMNFFNSIKSSKINQISPTFAKAFETDREWKNIYARFKAYKDWDIGTANDDMVREVKEFGQQFQNKFKNFKHALLQQQQLSSLKGSASVDLICERQELKVLLEKKRQEIIESEANLASFVAQKESEEEKEKTKLMQLQTEIDSLKKKLIESEKEYAQVNNELSAIEISKTQLEKLIKEETSRFMKSIIKRLEQDDNYFNKIERGYETATQSLKNSVQHYENQLRNLSQYENSL